MQIQIEKVILSYLTGSDVLAYRDNDIFVNVAVITEVAGEFELKVIAVLIKCLGNGIVSSMIGKAKQLAKELVAKII